MTNTKVLISVFKNHKFFSKNITTYRESTTLKFTTFVHFPPQKFRSGGLGALKLGTQTLSTSNHVVSKLQLSTLSIFSVKSEIKKFRLKNSRFFVGFRVPKSLSRDLRPPKLACMMLCKLVMLCSNFSFPHFAVFDLS